MKNIKENFSASPADTEQLVNPSYNISKVDDPVELKRLNNYITSVLTSAPFQSRTDTMNQLRLKLNLLGFDIDVPKSMKQTGSMNLTLPLKRFGGILGIDDQGKKLENPHGPGPKLNIELSSIDDFVNAKVVPVSDQQLPIVPSVEPKEETPSTPVIEPKVEVKENITLGKALKRIIR